MMKRILHIVVWLLISAWFIIILGFVAESNEALLCRQLTITVSDSSDIRFITSDMVRNSILSSGIKTQGYPVQEIRIRDIEFLLEKNPYIENAEVYTNVAGDMNVDISQRKPLMRLMPGGKKGFYIDQTGTILPLSDDFSPMVLLLTGEIDIPEILRPDGQRIIDIRQDVELKYLMEFARLVQQNPFWNDQIVQVYRSTNGDYEIIPRVGAHQIQFGKMENYETKLNNLKLLYDKGLKKYGWNNYNKINLKYSNQIICTKR